MSYRSKRTFAATSGDTFADASVSEDKQSANSRLATSQLPKPSSLATSQPPKPSSLSTLQPPKPPLDSSANKWGPFAPPKLQSSQTFGHISESIKSSLAAKNITTSTLSPSVKASQSSMQQKFLVKTSNSYSNPPQPPFDTSQRFTPSTTGAEQQQRKLMQGKLVASKQLQGLVESQQHQRLVESKQQQQRSTIEKNIPEQQQRTPSVSLEQKEARLPQIEIQQQPHTRTQQPISSPSIVTKSPSAKRVAAAPVGAKKPVMSRTPRTLLDTMASDKNPNKKLINNESIRPCQNKVSQPYMHVNKDTHQMEPSPEPFFVETELRQNHSSEDSSSESEDLNGGGSRGTSAKNAVVSRPRRRTVVPNWPENVNFDEKEEAIAFDANGKRHLVKGPVQPRDVWIDRELRYYVEFNNINQPLRKGGSILVSFLGDVAKREAFCPVGVISWHKMKKKMKADIVTLVRNHFVIPDGELFNKAILKRTAKYWKNYRFFLREGYFDPVQTKEQNYENRPDGVNKQNWTELVDYWFSPIFQKLSKLGKDARASQAHVHFSGATSFANRRADLEKERGKFSELDFYKSVYTRKDGSFKKGTLSRQFMEDANIKVNENLASSSSSKSRVDIENKVFNELMYKDEIPKRPLNYGFGVNQSDIFGVQGLLRKERPSYGHHNVVEVENLKAELSVVKKQNEALENKFDETTQTFKMIASHFAHFLKEVRNGNASAELLEAAESAIHFVDTQIPNVSSGNGKK